MGSTIQLMFYIPVRCLLLVEGAIEGIPSVGFRLIIFPHDADFSYCRPYVSSIAEQVLANGLPKNTLLNVNFPQTAGFKVLKFADRQGTLVRRI